MLSLGLSVIFGLLNIINFTHGAQYMMGVRRVTSCCSMPESATGGPCCWPGGGRWWAWCSSASCSSALLSRSPLRAPPHLRPWADHPGIFRNSFGSSGLPYAHPRPAHRRPQPRLHGAAELPGVGHRLLAGRLPGHLVRHRAHQARLLPARGHENPALVQAFGINVPRMITLTYGSGSRRGARGVLAAPIYQVNPLMARI